MEIQNLPQLPPIPLSTISIKIVTLLGRKYLLVPDRAKIRSVLTKDIVRLEGIKNYTILQFRPGRHVLLYQFVIRNLINFDLIP